jgi:hypothetical protein
VAPNPVADKFIVSAKGVENGDYTFKLSNVAGQIKGIEKTAVDGNIIQKQFFDFRTPQRHLFSFH